MGREAGRANIQTYTAAYVRVDPDTEVVELGELETGPTGAESRSWRFEAADIKAVSASKRDERIAFFYVYRSRSPSPVPG